MVTNIRLFRKICILQEELARVQIAVEPGYSAAVQSVQIRPQAMAIVEHVTVHAVLASGRCVSKAVAPVQMG